MLNPYDLCSYTYDTLSLSYDAATSSETINTATAS